MILTACIGLAVIACASGYNAALSFTDREPFLFVASLILCAFCAASALAIGTAS